jgi:hypothetical protein
VALRHFYLVPRNVCWVARHFSRALRNVLGAFQHFLWAIRHVFVVARKFFKGWKWRDEVLML